uniref:Origin recognition complex subunit 1 n=1 Tax=Octactis speculum TaxID=3111310 RepID=A0A7S2BNX1_9STRA|mmetsp:Transcript_25428/g.34947  ORF Transcript_25428/g.34947 Transcript_25428/m.34947 type:complete len:381 (+) Transcript_25428:442-1584(+)
MPGTGKTATILRAVAALQEDLGPFQFVNINGARFDDPFNVYTELLSALTNKTEKPNKALQLLNARFSQNESPAAGGPKKKKTKGEEGTASSSEDGKKQPFVVVLVDELDYLSCPKQTVIYNLLDWPTRSASHLLVIGVSNTMNLPERLGSKIQSRIVTRISFKPYNKSQVEKIVLARLSEKDVGGVFEPDAITMAAAKVAAYSGDIRRALKLCATAAEIRMDSNGMRDHDHDQSSAVQARVTVKDVQKADRDLHDSTVIEALRMTSTAEALIVCAVAAEVRVQGTEGCDLDKIQIRIRGQANRLQADGHKEYFAPSHAEVIEICDRLQEAGVLRIDFQGKHRMPRLYLCVPDNAVAEALSGGPVKRFIPQNYSDWGYHQN